MKKALARLLLSVLLVFTSFSPAKADLTFMNILWVGVAGTLSYTLISHVDGLEKGVKELDRYRDLLRDEKKLTEQAKNGVLNRAQRDYLNSIPEEKQSLITQIIKRNKMTNAHLINEAYLRQLRNKTERARRSWTAPSAFAAVILVGSIAIVISSIDNAQAEEIADGSALLDKADPADLMKVVDLAIELDEQGPTINEIMME